MTHQVLLFYIYTTIDEPEALAARIRSLAERYELLGRAIVATEGVNVTLEGTTEATEAFLAEFLEDEHFSAMQVKRSVGNGEAFPKLSVKVRNEIVGTGFDSKIDPRVKTAPRLTPEALREWIENGEDFAIVDMRNDYEYQSGHFAGSVNPGLEASRDLPSALPKLEPLKRKKVVTVCTGGVRCEKMSAFLLENGFEDVYQLENGIHGYMEKYPGKDFEGTLYTFDNRLTMDFGGEEGAERVVVGRCKLCDGATEKYVNCANNLCHLHFLACESCQGDAGTPCSEACTLLAVQPTVEAT